jgi:hypothetical protein
MPVNAKEVKIVKIPLSEKDRVPDYPKNFSSMPVLYLELIENKGKIKQDLINKEYVPENVKVDSLEPKPENKPENKSKDEQKVEKFVEKFVSSDKSKSKSIDSDSTSSSSSSRTSSSSSSSTSTSLKSRKEKSKSQSKSVSSSSSTDNNSIKDKDVESDNLSVRLKELLEESNTEKGERSAGSKFKSYQKYKLEQNKKNLQPPPTLAELQQQGQYVPPKEIRDINNIPRFEKEDEDRKRELMFKFDLLKKSYPTAQNVIPEYTIHSDIGDMTKTYDMTVKKLSLDSSVENYKTYLTGGFMVVEFAFGNFLGFDMQGFTQQQIINMHSYEKLLIELGEKSYVPEGSDWPVELRLLFIIIMNAGFFIISKMIMKRTGANILNMVNGMKTPQTNNNTNRQKRKMKGPDIELNQIPDVN